MVKYHLHAAQERTIHAHKKHASAFPRSGPHFCHIRHAHLPPAKLEAVNFTTKRSGICAAARKPTSRRPCRVAEHFPTSVVPPTELWRETTGFAHSDRGGLAKEILRPDCQEFFSTQPQSIARGQCSFTVDRLNEAAIFTIEGCAMGDHQPIGMAAG